MNLYLVTTDAVNNITELLSKTIKFTQARQKVLIENIHNIHTCGFRPKDLPVQEFAQSLNSAILEHLQNKRLLFRDSENVKFGINSCMQTMPLTDEYAQELFDTNKDEYLELQISKLLENSLNQRIAAELLRQQQQTLLRFDKKHAQNLKDKPTTTDLFFDSIR